MNQIIDIKGKAIERISYKGVPVITMPMVDDLHGKSKGMAKNAFGRHKKKLIEGEDYYFVPQEEWKPLLVAHEMSHQKQKTRGGHTGDMVFLTETGYVMLIKVFDDDLSWEIYRLMVRSYFAGQGIMPASFPLPEIKLQIDLGRLAKQADVHLDGKASLRLLHHFTGIPVNDLIAEVERKELTASAKEPGQEAQIVAHYLYALLREEKHPAAITTGSDENGYRFLMAETSVLLETLQDMGIKKKMPLLDYDPVGFGRLLAKLSDDLEDLGWARVLKKVSKGRRFYQFTYVSELG